MGLDTKLDMKLNTAQCYQALLTHDTRFDGIFFAGVSTTRLDCRTVCTAGPNSRPANPDLTRGTGWPRTPPGPRT